MTAAKQPTFLKRLLRAIGTGLKIIGKTLLLLPLLAGMLWVNYRVDVSNVFQPVEEGLDIAEAMLAGKALDNYDQMNERETLALMASHMEAPYEVMSFGSSRVLQLRSDVVGNIHFFNAGLSGADFLDLVGMPYLFDRAGMNPQTLILELDPWILSDCSYSRHPQSDRNLYDEFLTVRLGIPTDYRADFGTDTTDAAKREALSSPSYFQGNLQWLLQLGQEAGSPEEAPSVNTTEPFVYTGDFTENTRNIKLGDGSVLYDSAFRNWNPAQIEEEARRQAAEFFWMESYTEPSEQLCARFDRFVSYYRSQGVEVVFLLTPYHPLVYNRAQEYPQLYPGFFLTEPWFEAYAKENNIPLYGSYNPFVAGLLEEYFFDGLHLREEGLAQILPPVEEIRGSSEDGWAASPWFTRSARVEENTAAEMVKRRYAVPENEELRPMPPEQQDGAQGYVFGRYDGTGDEAILLARYLVTQNDGVVYRSDDALGWVVDPRF